MKPSKLSFLKVWKLAFFYMLILLPGLLSSLGCVRKQKPSFIIVALDRLSFNSFSCSDERSMSSSGLATLCQEAIRFTHAYTTSPQPAAAMGSVLFGSYPYVHRLHRGSGRISAKEKSLGQIADAQGYRTGFFSSAPSVMRKTGLSKGFDIFDDLSFLESKNYVTDFKHQAESALNWMQESKGPSLTVIYNSELDSLNETETDTSVFEKLDENLSNFFNELKSQDAWNSNYIIVVGLQGKSNYNRPDESMMSNLHSENTNVALFVKPPRQKGDDGVNLKVDTFVNLADLGYSLIRTFDASIIKSSDEAFPVIDLSTLWKASDQNVLATVDRKILIETVNPWSQLIESRFAVLYKNLVFLENPVDELYNSLTDGLETIDISASATANQNDFKNENRKALALIRQSTDQNQWLHYKTSLDDWVQANREYWLEPGSRAVLLEGEFQRFKDTKISQPLTTIMIQNFAVNNKQELLKEINLKIEPQKNYEKDMFLEEARRQSMNLSLENLWGLWGKSKNWAQSGLTKEYQ